VPKLDDMKLHTTGEGGVSPPIEEEGGFPERLKLAMAGQSARAFARAIGKSDAVVRQYLSGESEPTRKVLLAIAHATNVTIEWLVSGKGEMYPSAAVRRVFVETPSGSINASKLEAIMTAVKEAIKGGCYEITLEQEAKVVSGIYELTRESESINKSAILQLLKAFNKP